MMLKEIFEPVLPCRIKGGNLVLNHLIRPQKHYEISINYSNNK